MLYFSFSFIIFKKVYVCFKYINKNISIINKKNLGGIKCLNKKWFLLMINVVKEYNVLYLNSKSCYLKKLFFIW